MSSLSESASQVGLDQLIGALSDPGAYPIPVESVEVRHTHISVVFLAGRFVYKVKKPVALGFLDFSTLQRRQHFCQEEVRLNRRLAPAVYLGVVPIVQNEAGIRVEGSGTPIEWAVKMARLPDEATLQNLVKNDAVEPEFMTALAERLVAFHARGETNSRIAAFGRFDNVARNARENFEQTQSHVGDTVHPSVFTRVGARMEEFLARHRELIEARAERGMTRDTHGDLHLDHVYRFATRQPPEDLVIIDCIEFNERFRYADPVADMAFLVMDLAFLGRRDLAREFADTYFRVSGDAEGRALLPFYTAYRSMVRAKVRGMQLAEAETPEADRSVARRKARAHWLLALGEVEPPVCRPCLLLVGGLPGTGKSTLARELQRHTKIAIIRSDQVRKELLAARSPPLASGAGLYSAASTERTYAECLRRAESLLFEGQRVLVDATFGEEGRRRQFLEAATRWGVPGHMIECQADPEIAKHRLAERRGDLSDADWNVYRALSERWESPVPATQRAIRAIRTDAGIDEAIQQTLGTLTQWGLA